MLVPLLLLAMLRQPKEDNQSGTSLFKDCQANLRIADRTSTSDPDFLDSNYCSGFVEGFVTGLIYGLGKLTVCPEGAKVGTLVRVYVTYMEKHPVLLDKEKYEGLFDALYDSYPCRKRK